MADQGNAVTAKWVGPSGMQLFDGTVLEPGTVVDGIGKDEADGSAYWEIVSSDGDAATDVSSVRGDWSFGTEEGGEGTGRPVLDSQDTAPAQIEAPAPSIANPPRVTNTPRVTGIVAPAEPESENA